MFNVYAAQLTYDTTPEFAKAAQAINEALTNPGSHPEHHDRMRNQLAHDWPMLAKALEDFEKAVNG